MNYAEIKEYDIANGPGVRLSLFVSGCTHHCKGCFNEMTWDFRYGNPFTAETEDMLLEMLSEVSYRGLTLLGGEPFEPSNQRALLPFIRRMKKELPDKDLWAFTGYLFDRDLLNLSVPENISPEDSSNASLRELQRRPKTQVSIPETRELLSYIDVLVDGEYMEQYKDITLLYKGSSNQRTIDVQKSLTAGRIVIWDPGDVSISSMTHL